jgi:bifunctional non-homologous end joining protein LigD
MAKPAIPKSQRQYAVHRMDPAHRMARKLKAALAGKMPDFIEPLLATEAKPPNNSDWIHEIKYDGYRFQLHIRSRQARFLTRRGIDWSDRAPTLVAAAMKLPADDAIIDGEVMVQTPEGRSDFHALEKALKRGGDPALVYYAFDILFLGDHDLRDVELLDRKEILRLLLAGVEGPIAYSPHTAGDGMALWKNACKMQLEGIVSKRVDGRYRSGRNTNWLKAPCRHRDTFIVVGWAEKRGKFDGVYLAQRLAGELVYSGKLESVPDENEVLAVLKPLAMPKQPMRASRGKFPKAKWVKPRVLVDVEFRARTGDGLLRHPKFMGFREDLT